MRWITIWTLLLTTWTNGELWGQSVSISPEILIKNDFSYFYFPHPDGNISLLRDKSFRLSLLTLYQDFNWSVEKNLNLRGKKWRIIDIYGKGNDIDVFYITQEESQLKLIKSQFNQQGEVIQELILHASPYEEHYRNFQTQLSPNKQWICFLFEDQRSEKTAMVLNRNEDSVYCFKKLSSWLQLKSEIPIKQFLITDDGTVFIHSLIEQQEGKKTKLRETIVKLQSNAVETLSQVLPIQDLNILQSQLQYDNINKKLLYAALFSDKQERYPEGYLLLCYNHTFQMDWKKKTPFSSEMLRNWKGETSVKSIFRDGELKLRDIVMSQNGSSLLFFEYTREISRRPYFSSIDASNNLTSRWFDYYFDDLLVAHFDHQGNSLWEHILHKRQYSQDDDGIFSSFYIFKNPALLRIVFNDAVNSEGTVSEYLLKPNGDFIRKSVLNTTYKNLNLRFRDAMSIQSDEMLLPSESNGKLTLVKIQFN